MSQLPLGWLKVRCYTEVTGISQVDKHLSLPSIYGYRLAIDYFGVVKGRGWELSEFSGWVWESRFVTHYLVLIYEKSSLVWLASQWGRLLSGFPRGATLTTIVWQGGKTGLVFGRFKISVSVLYFSTPCAGLASYTDTSMSWCRDGVQGEAGSFRIWSLCSLY